MKCVGNKENLLNHFFNLCNQESVEQFFRALFFLEFVKGYSVRSFYPT